MADKKPLLTEDMKLPPGVVVTPGHVAPEFPTPGRPRISDRRIDADGKPVDLGGAEHLSTYKYEKQPEAPVDESALPRESVNEANAAASKK
jgi:hypothetical protein